MRKVLIVDDIASNLKLMGELLTDEFEVIASNNSKNVIDLCLKNNPDLILLDIMMPDIDGLTLCQLIKSHEEFTDIPVIFITAKTEADDIVRGFEFGAVDYITKPFNPLELLSRVRNQMAVLDQRDKIIELEKNNSILAMIVTANHELNQPLTTLQGYVHLLKDDLKTNNVVYNKKYLQRIEKSIEKISSILEKYSSSKDFEISPYLETDASSVKMVRFKDN